MKKPIFGYTRKGVDASKARAKDFAFSLFDYESLRVAKVIYQSGSGTVYHGLGYTPTFLLFAQTDDGYALYDTNEGNSEYAPISIDENNVYFTSLLSGLSSYVILFDNELS